VDLAYTYNHFRYGKFLTAADDYSGNSLPSVPSHTISFLADINFYKGLFLQANYYYASEIFLNDANTSTADPYHLAGLRTGWKSVSNKNHRFQVYIGVDNLFDKTYSLGNDINAPAGRFFNAAPRRNYFGGISWQFLNSK